MENNDLKEKIRKNVKERIAVSNIREEFDMKGKKSRKIIYGITSVAAVCILCVGITVNYNNLKNDKVLIGEKGDKEIEDYQKEKENVKEDNVIFNAGSIETATSISGKVTNVDGNWKDENVEENFGFIRNIEILKQYEHLRQGMVYVKENIEDTNYSKFQQYELIYYMDGNNAPSTDIIFTKEDKILQCMIPNESDFPSSTISGNEVKLFKAKNFFDNSKINGEAFFKYKDYKFYITSHRIDENDFIELIKSILNKNIISNNADKDIGVNEPINESPDYPDYYAGKYVDKNGNNVILLCEDNNANRKEICNILGITESKTTFKKVQYSYKYLTELQNKISKKMIDKEFTFVTKSAVMENNNNIKVTVTSNKESELNKIKALDTIGGAIEIQYDENGMSKTELLVEKE